MLIEINFMPTLTAPKMTVENFVQKFLAAVFVQKNASSFLANQNVLELFNRVIFDDVLLNRQIFFEFTFFVLKDHRQTLIAI